MNTTVLLRVAEEGAGEERLASLARALRAELLDLDVEDVRPARSGPPPRGSRAVDATAAGTLLALVNASAPALTGLIEAVRSWATREAGTRSVELTVGNDSLRITGASAKQQDRLVDAFVHKVAGRNPR